MKNTKKAVVIGKTEMRMLNAFLIDVVKIIELLWINIVFTNSALSVEQLKAKSSYFLYFFYFSSWAEKMESLTVKSSSDPEGYLAHPVNAYKLVKRLNTEWLELENLVLQDSAKGEDLDKIQPQAKKFSRI